MDYDLLVIGGGTAGMSAARSAVRRKARVALIQAGPIGGECTFVGCVPSKTLIEAASQGADFATAMARVRATVARIAATETADVLRNEGIDVIEGWGRLLGAEGAAQRWRSGAKMQRVAVEGRDLRARHLVVAVGAGPLLPSIPGLADLDVLTNENVFELQQRPASLLVLGGGPIGVELAQAFARLGTAVTVVEAAERLLPREDPQASAIVAAALAADGVTVVTGRRVIAAHDVVAAHGEAPEVGVELSDGGHLAAQRLLVALGRCPTTGDLDLAAAGVGTDEQGFVRTDLHLRTTVAGIWAAGDITGRSPFTHAADEMGRVAAGNALSQVAYRSFRDGWIPAVTYTAPEIARVGQSEAAAAGPGVRVAYLPMGEVDRAVTAGRTEGYVKLIAGPRSATRHLAGGKLLGASIVAERAGEMIALPTLALRSHMSPARLATATQAYPTWSVAVQQAAAQLFMESGGRRARPASDGVE